jgi:hypothetical protein
MSSFQDLLVFNVQSKESALSSQAWPGKGVTSVHQISGSFLGLMILVVSHAGAWKREVLVSLVPLQAEFGRTQL